MEVNNVPHIAIVGGGVCGFSAIGKLCCARVTIFEASPNLHGEATPFGSILGAQALSFNTAEDRINRVLNRILREYPDMLVHLDDGLISAGILSRTSERPQGWNRSTGQWEHYALNEGTTSFQSLLRALAGGSESLYGVETGCKVEAIEQGGKKGTFQLVVNGEVRGDFDAVLIAIPAKEAAELLQHSVALWDNHVLDVLLNCAKAYVKRHAVLVRFFRESEVGSKLLDKFRDIFCASEGSHDGHKIGQELGGMARELDVASEKGSVALLSLTAVGDEVVEVTAHGKKGESIDFEAITKFLEDWLCIKREEVTKVQVVTERHYQQARPEVEFPNRPHAPLRERGCVICKANEGDENVGRVVAGGDFAVGLGVISSAISSGMRAAEIINKSLER
ncbi:hypothetical protein TrRE_jg5450 [Triparma retinervis]|uniref:Amine oxidase domain-containing protein n=1 Tax=Triparma retinervis TaxID=2557542 RepID=A0A9W7FB06_9STRA|nr:hypothetical protein TrRE_jg5450 [Triparma retinervis]